jgi:hypothetical protein
MARDIDRKLRVTAAALGLITRKDLAAAFRRVNAATTFEIERAHKWLQGRSSPRDARLYQDWALVLDIRQSAEWIANSEFDVFVTVVAHRHNVEPETLHRLGTTRQVLHPDGGSEARLDLAGTYACYSNAWSPYFRGRIIRGTLTIADQTSGEALQVTYSEVLPTGRFQVIGTMDVTSRAAHLSLKEPAGDTQLSYCLFPPTSPVSVLGGLMCGATIIGPDSSPSVTRIIMIRLRDPSELAQSANAYLANGACLAQDLASLGLPTSSPQATDQRLSSFLLSGDGVGFDQPSISSYRAIVELFDREWLSHLAEGYDGRGEAR